MSNKLHPKHKVSRDDHAAIMLIVNGLPPIIRVDGQGKPIMRTAIKRGSQLKKSDLSSGTPLVKNAQYRVREFTYIDHESACFDLFKSAGMPAVLEYQTGVLKHKNRMVTKIQQENSKLRKMFNTALKWLKISK